MSSSELTVLLEAVARGEPLATDQLFPLVYDELRQLAKQKMAREATGHTLPPTGLVHEAYLRLAGPNPAAPWENRAHFFAAAAEAMRRILVEAARRKGAARRGGNRQRVPLEWAPPAEESLDPPAILSLHETLGKLEQQDALAAQVVKLRYFAGLTFEEVAELLQISVRTAKRNWSFARAWLQREVARG